MHISSTVSTASTTTGSICDSWINNLPLEMITSVCNYPSVSGCSTNAVKESKPVNTKVSNVKTIYHEGQPVGVKVYFTDGTAEKAICEEGDRPNFSLDFGITICLCKKLMGGSHQYNNAIHKIRKDMEARAYAIALAEEKKREANEAKQKARQEKARKKREAREREIEIQKEAYLRAMREFQSEKLPDMQLPDHG